MPYGVLAFHVRRCFRPDATVLRANRAAESVADDANQPVMAAQLLNPRNESWHTPTLYNRQRKCHSGASLHSDVRVTREFTMARLWHLHPQCAKDTDSPDTVDRRDFLVQEIEDAAMMSFSYFEVASCTHPYTCRSSFFDRATLWNDRKCVDTASIAMNSQPESTGMVHKWMSSKLFHTMG
jgi:hypothetical protein